MELISFETAKLAKEKGFNKKCEYFYQYYLDNNVHDLLNYEQVKLLGLKELHMNSIATIRGHLEYSAPYQYQLMNWLREKRNICISVIPSVGMALKRNVSFTYQIRGDSNGEKFKISYSSMDFYSNYEECLETALQEALKLIK